ncbi:MAG: cytochrome b N-terminal domain-containing protein, partial [Lapillicoccus sp.]
MSTSTDQRSAAALRDGDEVVDAPPGAGIKAVGGVAGWLDDRTGGAGFVAYLLKKVFPDHWTFMLGEIAMYSMIICLLSGTFLTFWFVPSAGQVVYDGSYLPLQGITVSEAYRSSVDISFDVRGGLLIRQIHHWAALMFIVAITVHMLRVFFTGAFRKPRELNWVIGSLLSMLALIEGFA